MLGDSLDPKRQPSGAGFDVGEAELGKFIRQSAVHGAHQTDHLLVRMAQSVSGKILVVKPFDPGNFQTAGVAQDRYVEFLRGGEDRIEVFVCHRFIHRPRRECHADEAKLVDRAPQFAHRLLHVLKRQDRQSFEPLRRGLAVGVQPIVVGPCNGAGQVGVFDPAASAQGEAGKQRCDIDALDIHVCQTRARVRCPFPLPAGRGAFGRTDFATGMRIASFKQINLPPLRVRD